MAAVPGRSSGGGVGWSWHLPVCRPDGSQPMDGGPKRAIRDHPDPDPDRPSVLRGRVALDLGKAFRLEAAGSRPVGSAGVDTTWTALSTALVAYALGSIPTAYLVGRLVRGIDLRGAGEGNVGARNAFHEVGHRWGVAVFAVDIAKGAAVALLSGHSPLWQFGVAAVFLVMGHAYPVWLGFVGGKGLACGGRLPHRPVPLGGPHRGGAVGGGLAATHRFLPTVVAMAVVTFRPLPFTGGSGRSSGWRWGPSCWWPSSGWWTSRVCGASRPGPAGTGSMGGAGHEPELLFDWGLTWLFLMQLALILWNQRVLGAPCPACGKMRARW